MKPVFKYLNVSYKDKERAKAICPDGIDFDGDVKKWFIKKGYEESEFDFKIFNPHFPDGGNSASSSPSKKRCAEKELVTPTKKPKNGNLSALVLNHVQVKKLVKNIGQEYSKDVKLYYSATEVKKDLEEEVESIFYDLKESIVQDSMKEHFSASNDFSCVKNVVDYLVDVAQKKQAETTATVVSDDEEDEVSKSLKQQLALHLLKKAQEKEAKSGKKEDDMLSLQIEKDMLQAEVVALRAQMKNVTEKEVVSTVVPSSSVAAEKAVVFSTSSYVDLTSSSNLKVIFEPKIATTLNSGAGVKKEEIVSLATTSTTVKVEKEANKVGNNIVVILTNCNMFFNVLEVKK